MCDVRDDVLESWCCVKKTTGTYVHMFREAQARTSGIITEALDFSKKKKSPIPFPA